MYRIQALFCVLLVAALCFVSDFVSASSDNKKLLQKLKHYKKSKHLCSDFEFHPTIEKRMYMSASSSSSSGHAAGLSSVKSFGSAYELFFNQCSSYIDSSNSSSLSSDAFAQFKRESLVELKWRFQFFESPHCIRVELDLGNVSRFKSLVNYDYYMFSYRELAHENTHVKRQRIVNATNTLTIHRVQIRPYIVCVTFYRSDALNELIDGTVSERSQSPAPAVSANGNAGAEQQCDDYVRSFRADERMHDVDLCVDIDTQSHFLSGVVSGESHLIANRELVMVLFIICLLVAVLASITLAHYIIEKPKKRRMLKALRDYVQRKAHHAGADAHHHHHNHNHNNNHHHPTQSSIGTINNSQTLALDAGKDGKSNSRREPIITVTDFSSASHSALADTQQSGAAGVASSSSSSLLSYSAVGMMSSGGRQDASESEPLLSAALSSSGVGYQNATAAAAGTTPTTTASSVSSCFTPVTGSSVDQQGLMYKVMFHVGETILEESPSQCEVKLSNDEIASGAFNNDDELDTNHECIKSISHLLDDKPWLYSSPSQSVLCNQQQQQQQQRSSRSNSLVSASLLPNGTDFAANNESQPPG